MTVDISSLENAVRERGEELFDAALDALKNELDAVVPISGNYSGEKLRDNQEILVQREPNRFVATITYTLPQAEYTEYGTDTHDIYPKSDDGVLAFFWPKIGEWAFLKHVVHPGSHMHDGWFSKTIAKWPDIVADQSS